METKYTKGPWFLMESGFSIKDPVPTVYTTNDDLEIICKVYKDGNMFYNVQDNIANAKLIAAAPELLEACVKALGIINHLKPNVSGLGLIQLYLKDAVKKATE